MTKNQLLTRMIKIYGFEHPVVIDFAKQIEKGFRVETLEQIVIAHEEHPVKDWD